MVNFRTFKSYARAAKFANGRPFLQIGCSYVVSENAAIEDVGSAEIVLWHGSSDVVVGRVTLDHLNRLGNANIATADPTCTFPRIFSEAG